MVFRRISSVIVSSKCSKINSKPIFSGQRQWQMAVDAILKTLGGEKPENMVDEDVWEKRRI